MDWTLIPTSDLNSSSASVFEQKNFAVNAEKVVASIPTQSERPTNNSDKKGSPGGTQGTEFSLQDNVWEIQSATNNSVNREISQVRTALFSVVPNLAILWTNGVQWEQVQQFASLVRSMILVRRVSSKL